jgi:AraC-like DNA-binding protein
MVLRELPERPCYSLWLIRPFLEVLRSKKELSGPLAAAAVFEPDQRISVQTVHEMLEGAVAFTGDPNLGLKAAQRLKPGDAGAIDYLVASVATVEDAIAVATRYMRLVNDALTVRLVLEGERAILRLDNSIEMPTAAMDFQLGGIFRTHFRQWLSESSDLRVFLPYPRPEDPSEHEHTFAPATVTFDAPFSGYVFPKATLGKQLPKADSTLHHVLRKLAEQTLAQLPRTQTLSQRVRDLVATELGRGNPTAPHIAKRLGMSTSTLGRRLEREETTFRDLLDDLRKQLATQYLTNPDLELAEVALLLGFSQSTAFHRAFRRWTGQTPAEFRRKHSSS